MPREEDIFADVLAAPTAERTALLDRTCAGDAVLRARIEALLAGFAETERALPRALVSKVIAFAGDRPGRRIGRYRLLEPLGEGGCGIVWLAEQEEPVRRRVAVKEIKLGMDTKAVIARFEAERQALAMMDHPGIAKVFDAGATETGRPFFVMELVRGVAITAYCDQHRLAPRDRLALFIQVCGAVHHAHLKGIVHRDLKPSNILVAETDGTAVPKVIDFGVAKATQGRLTEQTIYTRYEQLIGTPAYMSPEQADSDGADVDARSDLYALGVLLYELLAGRPPFDARQLSSVGGDRLRRQIREAEPPAPSTRARTLSDSERVSIALARSVKPAELPGLLRGDLDWIVLRCLEKDRSRRYESAHALAEDLQRHLDDQPVIARPRRVGYIARKFLRRHRTTAASAAVLLVGVSAGAWGWLRLHPPKPGTIEETPAVTGPAAQARALTERAIALYTGLAFQRSDLAVAEDLARQATEMDPTSARAWGVRAWVQAAYVNRNWDLSPERLDAAQNLANHALALDPNVPEALNALAEVLLRQGALPAAEQMARRAIAAAPDNFRSRVYLSNALAGQRRGDEALAVLLEAERRDPDNVLIHYELSTAYGGISRRTHRPSNLPAALEELRTIARLHPFASAYVVLAKYELIAGDLPRMRDALDHLSRMSLAEQADQRAVYWAAMCSLCDRQPDKAFAATNLTATPYFDDDLIASPKAWLRAWAQSEAGHSHLAQGEWEAAETVLRQRLRDDPQNRLRYQSQLAITLAWLGRNEEAQSLIAPLQRALQDEVTSVHASYASHYYAALGDAAKAAPYLFAGNWGPGHLRFSPMWDKIRSAPEFQAELDRITRSFQPDPTSGGK